MEQMTVYYCASLIYEYLSFQIALMVGMEIAVIVPAQ